MEILLQALGRNEGLIYLVLTLWAIVNLRWLWRAWRERSAALFGLEREIANRRLSAALASFVVVFMLFVSEFILATFFVPAMPGFSSLATPTVDVLGGRTAGMSSEEMTALASTPGAAVPFGSSGCVPGSIVIAAPRPGQEVQGIVDLVGTVAVPNLGFYKFEVAPQGTTSWSTIFAGSEGKINESLGMWDTTTLTPGDYQLRLVVTDNQGQTLPDCIIPLRILP